VALARLDGSQSGAHSKWPPRAGESHAEQTGDRRQLIDAIRPYMHQLS
jgi:hypothetical protein